MIFEKTIRHRFSLVAFLVPVMLVFSTGCPASTPTSMEEVKREPNLEKRADQAVKYAELEMKEAGLAFRAGDRAKMMAALEQMRDALLLAKTSLEETGKPTRKLTGHYKKAEKGSTRILRLLNDLADALYLEDRPPVERILKNVQTLHDGFLMAVMRRK